MYDNPILGGRTITDNCGLYLGMNGGLWTGLVDLLFGTIRRPFMCVLRRASGGGGEGENSIRDRRWGCQGNFFSPFGRL